MRGEPNDFWGKLEQGEGGRVVAWNPVEAHCADVAACCEALLHDTLLGARMARLAGREHLHPVLRDRLTVLAALHDLGKYAISFQNRPYPDRMPQGGHVEPIVKALNVPGRVQDAILDLLAPIGGFGDAAEAYLAASISHHGRPEKIGDGDTSGFDPVVFAPARGLVPLHGMKRLVDLTRRWCPAAFEAGPPDAELPDVAAVQHFFAGIVMLGDWLGSDSRVFEFVEDGGDPMPLARERAARIVRDRFLSIGSLRGHCLADFAVFDTPATRFVPRPAQVATSAQPLPRGEPSLTVLEAETGSGKTEAAIHRFAQLFRAGAVDGMYFALPTRTSATQIHRRVVEAVASTFSELGPEARPPVVLAVPGYLRVDDESGTALPDFKYLWPDTDRGRNRHRTWAVENSKRYLAGSVVVGTIDQALLSTLVVAHAHLRATALSRLFLVVDEVHASDAYMTALLDQVLAFHFACGGHALLMSATLGTSVRRRFFARLGQEQLLEPLARLAHEPLAASERVAYPAVHHGVRGAAPQLQDPGAGGHAKRCEVRLWPAIDAPDHVAARALDAARAGARVLVLRNTVADAVATQRALESLARDADEALLFRVADEVTLHHARFVDADRRLLDDAIEARLGKHADRSHGAVVVATQTVQQSLDLDADFLITDLCPMDVLLQRIGRLHRHMRPLEARPDGFRVARCDLLDPGPLNALLDDRGTPRARHGFGSVYEDLRILEATRTLLGAQPELEIPTDNRRLVERTTHPDALAAVVAASPPAMALHARSADMSVLVQRQVAQGHVIDRRKPMGAYGFPSRETSGRIATRLGESDRLLELAAPFVSPFGATVRAVKVPHWLAREIPAEPTTTAVSRGDGVRLIVADAAGSVAATFVYDRLGLRGEAAETTPLYSNQSTEDQADE